MLYAKREHAIDPLAAAVVRELNRVAKKLHLPYFVVGAMARDIVLTHVFGLPTGRATRDVDVAIAVESWDQFESVKKELVSGGRFEPASKQWQRLHYKAESGKAGYPIDIIPFRGVEDAMNKIAWPRDVGVIMNVAGYEDVLASSIEVQIADGLVVRVASLPGLVLLKLFAWADRRTVNSKDAQDLTILFETYAQAGNEDRLYEEAIDVMEAVDFDLALAGPRLLGRDVGRIASKIALDQLEDLLASNATLEKLVADMARQVRAFDDSLVAAQRLLDQFKAGLSGA